jgi:ABC-type molybdate transport system permease subunit
MRMLLNCAAAAATIVAVPFVDVSLTKSFSSAAFNTVHAAAVDGRGTRRVGLHVAELECWDDRSGQPHCHA